MSLPTTGREVKLRYLTVRQPIGDFYIASISSRDLYDISTTDIRRMADREVESYLGIQRPLSRTRVEEIRKYIQLPDASFPTAIIIAVDINCVELSDDFLTLREWMPDDKDAIKIPFNRIAHVLDGQHRLAALGSYEGDDFEVNVSIFIGMDIADQAQIFSTVNLAQTKVNKSLAYDLYEYAARRSPEKTAHNITVTLDRNEKSALYQKIKRLGVTTDGRSGETISQATFVGALLPLITSDALQDRVDIANGKKLSMNFNSNKLIFRELFILGKDVEIALELNSFFQAVALRWPIAWASLEKGMMLNRTNGIRGLMRVLVTLHNEIKKSAEQYNTETFKKYFDLIPIGDNEFNTSRFLPGTSGETEIYKLFTYHFRFEDKLL